ncbi:MAG: hypothetical protein ACK4GC_02255 [Paracoccaceae bacterium]
MNQLDQLKRLSLLIRDRDLSRLSLASAQKARTESQLAALDRTGTTTALDPVICAQVVDRFGLWTTNRRILLNQQLARDTVTWMAEKTAAQRSFGRADVLGKLSSKR